MAIINLTYLTQIPNLSITGYGGIADSSLNNNEEVNKAISRYEYKFLVDALGTTTTSELYDQLGTSGTWKSSALQKYKDLVDGDSSVNWLGLRYTIGDNKISMIANYVFCKILFNKSQGDLTELGVSISGVEQSTIISEAPMYTEYWNEMINWRNRERYCYYRNKDYPITLEDYLRQSEDFNLDNFQYNEYNYANRHGL